MSVSVLLKRHHGNWQCRRRRHRDAAISLAHSALCSILVVSVSDANIKPTPHPRRSSPTCVCVELTFSWLISGKQTDLGRKRGKVGRRGRPSPHTHTLTTNVRKLYSLSSIYIILSPHTLLLHDLRKLSIYSRYYESFYSLRLCCCIPRMGSRGAGGYIYLYSMF